MAKESKKLTARSVDLSEVNIRKLESGEFEIRIRGLTTFTSSIASSEQQIEERIYHKLNEENLATQEKFNAILQFAEKILKDQANLE